MTSDVRLPKLILLYKILKIVKLVIANRVVLNHINTEILAINIQKKRQARYTRIQYNGQDTHVLSLEDVEKKR